MGRHKSCGKSEKSGKESKQYEVRSRQQRTVGGQDLDDMTVQPAYDILRLEWYGAF
jgi:hypothetical protein